MAVFTFKKSVFLRGIAALLSLLLGIMPAAPVVAQGSVLLPAPGTLMNASAAAQPSVLRGLKVNAAQPLKMQFIIDQGDGESVQDQAYLEQETQKLVRYFLAALTTPEDDLWVNLSPYESDRILPDDFGQTEMGRDLLAQDYILKQLSSSLTYPESELGRRFWDRVYAKAFEQYGTTDVPMDTFHKVWIVPERAKVYAEGETVMLGEAKLDVMLERDYVAQNEKEIVSFPRKRESKNSDTNTSMSGSPIKTFGDDTMSISTQIMKSVILPEIKREVNEGEHFAPLRQIYSAIILATWYKRNLKNSIINHAYSDQNKVGGVDVDDPNVIDHIYEQYVDSFKQGAYDFIRNEQRQTSNVKRQTTENPHSDDPMTYDLMTFDHEGSEAPRRYFSGGTMMKLDHVMTTAPLSAFPARTFMNNPTHLADINLHPRKAGDNAMAGDSRFLDYPYQLSIIQSERSNVSDRLSAIQVINDKLREFPDLSHDDFLGEMMAIASASDGDWNLRAAAVQSIMLNGGKDVSHKEAVTRFLDSEGLPDSVVDDIAESFVPVLLVRRLSEQWTTEDIQNVFVRLLRYQGEEVLWRVVHTINSVLIERKNKIGDLHPDAGIENDVILSSPKLLEQINALREHDAPRIRTEVRILRGVLGLRDEEKNMDLAEEDDLNSFRTMVGGFLGEFREAELDGDDRDRIVQHIRENSFEPPVGLLEHYLLAKGRVLLIGDDVFEDYYSQFTEELIYLKKNAGLTHVGFAIDPHDAERFQQFLAGKITAQEWGYDGFTVQRFYSGESDDDEEKINRIEQFRVMAKVLQQEGLEFVFYGDFGRESENELKIEAGVEQVRRVLSDGQQRFERIVLLGSENAMGRRVGFDGTGGQGKNTLGSALIDELGNDVVHAVYHHVLSDAYAWAFGTVNNLHEVLQEQGYTSSFAIEIVGTPITKLSLDFNDNERTFALFDGLILRVELDGGDDGDGGDPEDVIDPDAPPGRAERATVEERVLETVGADNAMAASGDKKFNRSSLRESFKKRIMDGIRMAEEDDDDRKVASFYQEVSLMAAVAYMDYGYLDYSSSLVQEKLMPDLDQIIEDFLKKIDEDRDILTKVQRALLQKYSHLVDPGVFTALGFSIAFADLNQPLDGMIIMPSQFGVVSTNIADLLGDQGKADPSSSDGNDADGSDSAMAGDSRDTVWVDSSGRTFEQIYRVVRENYDLVDLYPADWPVDSQIEQNVINEMQGRSLEDVLRELIKNDIIESLSYLLEEEDIIKAFLTHMSSDAIHVLHHLRSSLARIKVNQSVLLMEYSDSMSDETLERIKKLVEIIKNAYRYKNFIRILAEQSRVDQKNADNAMAASYQFNTPENVGRLIEKLNRNRENDDELADLQIFVMATIGYKDLSYLDKSSDYVQLLLPDLEEIVGLYLAAVDADRAVIDKWMRSLTENHESFRSVFQWMGFVLASLEGAADGGLSSGFTIQINPHGVSLDVAGQPTAEELDANATHHLTADELAELKTLIDTAVAAGQSPVAILFTRIPRDTPLWHAATKTIINLRIQEKVPLQEYVTEHALTTGEDSEEEFLKYFITAVGGDFAMTAQEQAANGGMAFQGIEFDQEGQSIAWPIVPQEADFMAEIDGFDIELVSLVAIPDLVVFVQAEQESSPLAESPYQVEQISYFPLLKDEFAT